MAQEKITLTLKTVKLLAAQKYGYGVSATTSRFYKVTDEKDTIYTVSTTNTLYEGDTITASVVGENDWNGEHQIKLTRVSIVKRGPMEAWKYNHTPYIGNLISTDGEY